MTATPPLEDNIFGKYQKKISDAFYLDKKESEWVLSTLKEFEQEVMDLFLEGPWVHTGPEDSLIDTFKSNVDPGDEHER